MTEAIIAACDDPTNGPRPVSSSNKVAPSAQMSERASTSLALSGGRLDVAMHDPTAVGFGDGQAGLE
jgi:hypothetical protein